MFETSELNIRNQRVQRLYKVLFLMMTMLLILPVLLILGTLVVKGSSVISIDFLFTAPTDGMTAGGLFPALFGTVWLVAVALLISVPLGIAAAIYLSEYAGENWFTRIINLAIINLVSTGITDILKSVKTAPSYVITKGGITSSDVATEGLGVKRAMVLGQLIDARIEFFVDLIPD